MKRTIRLRNFNYYIREGINSFFVNGLMSFASVVIVTACLFMLGLYVVFSSNMNFVAEQLESKYEIQVLIEREASESITKSLGDRILTFENVNSAVFVSKQQALDIVKGKFDKNSHALDGLENDNPFRDSFTVTLNDLSRIEETSRDILALPYVSKVNSNKETLDALMRFTDVVRKVSFWIMFLLAIIGVFIISNTIRITLAARQREITIMKYVGATDFFIRTPFIVEGMLISAISVIVAIALLTQLYSLFAMGYGGIFGSDVRIMDMSLIFMPLTLALAAMGVVLSSLGCGISIRRYLWV